MTNKCTAYTVFIPSAPRRTSKLHHFKTTNFFTFYFICGSFLPNWTWIHIPHANPDPADQYQCRSGSTILLTRTTTKNKIRICRISDYFQFKPHASSIQNSATFLASRGLGPQHGRKSGPRFIFSKSPNPDPQKAWIQI